jgi:hypothetical protein
MPRKAVAPGGGQAPRGGGCECRCKANVSRLPHNASEPVCAILPAPCPPAWRTLGEVAAGVVQHLRPHV